MSARTGLFTPENSGEGAVRATSVVPYSDTSQGLTFPPSAAHIICIP